ncbi:TPA: hypothetical protein L1A39_002150 [Escherichia coli]|uniref:hypothetical protein n=1 Tax=Escherichia coli TaxID=562 RepID=UPI0015626099|nr:hypothetical protein [Escherichia coli]EIE5090988.1 hypothetical protein [Escherichia coli]EJT8725267.1 hypothetical protein [Escherichia coli]MCV7905784.1 hypothetical protein [Escherichia coli]MCV8077856.1 hypothetical protein [Escherichia coli]HAN6443359.1 hypothetical protein [Escherichia coli]
MARPAGSLNKRTKSANTTTPGEVKSFSLEHFLKNGDEQKWGDIPGRFHLRQRARNKNSVPEQRTGSLPAIQQRQNNILRMFTYQRSWLNMAVQVNIILVKMPSDR